MRTNDVFHLDDERLDKLDQWDIPEGWWSRGYEYAWAIRFVWDMAEVADMGCGYTFRPFKNALANRCNFVWAVDSRPPEDLDQFPPNLKFRLADFTNNTGIPDSSLDLVFCLSVLEETNKPVDAMKEFYRVLKPGGAAVLTFDIPYKDAPTPYYPGLKLETFSDALVESGFTPRDDFVVNKENAVYHEEYNLCVYHTVLYK